MTIRKRKNSYQLDYMDVTGKRVRISYKTKKEAELAEAEARCNKAKGISNVIDKSLTVAQACEEFIERYVKQYCKEKTKDEYIRIINKDFLPYWSNAKIANLTKLDIEKFLLYLKDERNLKNASINKYHNIMISIINKQIEYGKIFINVAKFKKYSVEENQGRALKQDEIEKLLNVCKKVKPKFYNMLFTALDTGLRKGELLALMWKNVDLNNKKIFVEYSEYKKKLTSPKTKNSIRYVEISEDLKHILLQQKLISGGSDFVFPNKVGGMIDRNNLNRLFNPVRKDSNIGEFRFHDLRHTFGSQLIEQGYSALYVQRQMGHSSIKVTFDIYGHLLNEAREKSIISANIEEKQESVTENQLSHFVTFPVKGECL